MPLQRQRLQMPLLLQMLQTLPRNHLLQVNQLLLMNLTNQMYQTNLWK